MRKSHLLGSRPSKAQASKPSELVGHPLIRDAPQADLLFDLLARLLTGHGSVFRLNIPEEAVCFTIDAGSEEEFVGCARGCIIPELQGPQAINRNGSVRLVSELAEKLASSQIIRIDAAVAEIADQQ